MSENRGYPWIPSNSHFYGPLSTKIWCILFSDKPNWTIHRMRTLVTPCLSRLRCSLIRSSHSYGYLCSVFQSVFYGNYLNDRGLSKNDIWDDQPWTGRCSIFRPSCLVHQKMLLRYHVKYCTGPYVYDRLILTTYVQYHMYTSCINMSHVHC